MNGYPAHNHTKAVTLLRRLSQVFPDLCVVHIAIAKYSALSGEDDVAITALARANECSDAKKHVTSIALAHVRIRQASTALQMLRCAEDTDGWRMHYWHVLGHAYSRLGACDAAIHCYQRAFRNAKTRLARVAVKAAIARCYSEHGDKDKAVSQYRDLVLNERECYLAHHLVQCQHDLDATAPLLNHMYGWLASGDRDPRASQSLHFAIGCLYDRSDLPNQAMYHFQAANKLRGDRMGRVDLDAFSTHADSMIATFTEPVIQNGMANGVAGDFLICIVGFPRSGTTLVEQMLSSVRGVHCLGEREHMRRVIKRIEQYCRASRYPLCMERIPYAILRELAESLRNELLEEAGHSSWVVTKLPADVWEMGLIKILFPGVRFLHCTRHPVDACLSCYMQNFEHLAWATALQDIAAYYRLYQRIVRHWQGVLPRDSVMDVAYEQLVQAPELVMTAICRFCSIPYESACLEFHRSKRPVDSASIWQVRRPLYKESIGRWRRYRDLIGPLADLDARCEPDVQEAGARTLVGL